MDSGSVVFDRHRLERRIGAGGTGEVSLATDLLLDQPVALKRIRVAGIGDEPSELLRDRALREARLTARLRHHRHVIATHDVCVDDGDVWLVLEYVPSKNLAQILRESGPLDPDRVARIGTQLADALAAAHALGIEHRDVTPGNVLISEDGIALLTDFGIARLAGDTQLTRTGALSGTIAYLAPEVARTGNSNPASDVFSLGATLYAAIEGRPPFGLSDNVVEQLNVVRAGIISPPRRAGKLAPLLMRLLAIDPVIRPDAATARDLLERFVTQVPARIRSPATSRPKGRWLRRRRLLIAVTVVVMVAAVSVSAILWSRGGGDQAYTGVPALPSTVGPIALTGDARAADPCALIDLRWLRQFGQPFIVISNFPWSCAVRIATTSGDAWLNVAFDAPGLPTTDFGQAQRLGDLTIVRHGSSRGDFNPYCEDMLVLADRTRVDIFTNGVERDRCKITEVGTATAVGLLARQGISYRPGRAFGWSIVRSDACTVLDPVALSRVPGLDSNVRFPGFANWSCVWGPNTTGSPWITVRFRLDDVDVFKYGNPTTIAGRRAWLHTLAGANNPQRCDAFVVHRLAPSATAATELFEVDVDAPGSAAESCARATELATAIETALPAP